MSETKKVVKNYEDLEFTDDFLFCNILTHNLDITKELLEIILQIKIRKVELVESQRSLKFTPFDRGVRFDVYVEDDENTVYNIEMQTSKQGAIGKRMRYYQGMNDLDMLESGDDFTKLKTSYIIFICLDKPTGFEKNLPLYTFQRMCREDGTVTLKDETTHIVVNASAPLKGISNELRNFLDFLKTKTVSDAFTQRLDQEVDGARTSKEWRKEYMTLSMKLEEYFQNGYDSCVKDLVRKAKNKGKSVEDIADTLDISVEEVLCIMKEVEKENQ